MDLLFIMTALHEASQHELCVLLLYVEHSNVSCRRSSISISETVTAYSTILIFKMFIFQPYSFLSPLLVYLIICRIKLN